MARRILMIGFIFVITIGLLGCQSAQPMEVQEISEYPVADIRTVKDNHDSDHVFTLGAGDELGYAMFKQYTEKMESNRLASDEATVSKEPKGQSLWKIAVLINNWLIEFTGPDGAETIRITPLDESDAGSATPAA